MKGNLTKVEDGMVVVDAKYFTTASGVMIPKYLPAYIEFEVDAADPTIITKIQILGKSTSESGDKKSWGKKSYGGGSGFKGKTPEQQAVISRGNAINAATARLAGKPYLGEESAQEIIDLAKRLYTYITEGK